MRIQPRFMDKTASRITGKKLPLAHQLRHYPVNLVRSLGLDCGTVQQDWVKYVRAPLAGSHPIRCRISVYGDLIWC